MQGPLRSLRTKSTVGGTITSDVTDEQRAALAREMGYETIGKPLPDYVTLQKVINSMPKSVSLWAYPDARPSTQRKETMSWHFMDLLGSCLVPRSISCYCEGFIFTPV